MAHDGEVVKIARRLQRLHEKAVTLIDDLENIDPDAARDIINQCFGTAWPEHVIRHYIDLGKWEVDATGIKRRNRELSK